MTFSLLSRAAALGLLSTAQFAAVGALDPGALTDSGLVVGETHRVAGSVYSVDKFLGIPFAVSPPERFGAPKPAKKSVLPILAKQKKPSCIQQFNFPEETRNFTIAVFNTPPVPESEDCLYLNVYAPNKRAPAGGWPVMYWLFGGALQFGSASVDQYDGAKLAANHDVIVVSGNYRTNVFGFSGSPELPIGQRNVGFLDQRLALDWVRRNIRAFGGDPNKVIFFGESAGASSADLLVAMTPNNPPFRAAILQSGAAGITTLRLGESPADGPWGGLVRGLGCENAASALACVRSKPAPAIKDYVERNMLSFQPIIDNVTTAANIRERRLAGSIAKVPILTGTNADEGTVFTIRAYPTRQDLLDAFFGFSPELQQAIIALYPMGSPGIETDADFNAAVFRDLVFTCPAKQLVDDNVSVGIPTWRYFFNATLPGSEPFPGAGAYHAAEIPLVFGTYNREDSTPNQVAVSNAMMAAWARFAKNPPQGPGWDPVVTTPNNMAVIRQGVSPVIGIGSSAAVDRPCALFNSLAA